MNEFQGCELYLNKYVKIKIKIENVSKEMTRQKTEKNTPQFNTYARARKTGTSLIQAQSPELG